jgi:hypothetical protein
MKIIVILFAIVTSCSHNVVIVIIDTGKDLDAETTMESEIEIEIEIEIGQATIKVDKNEEQM